MGRYAIKRNKGFVKSILKIDVNEKVPMKKSRFFPFDG